MGEGYPQILLPRGDALRLSLRQLTRYLPGQLRKRKDAMKIRYLHTMVRVKDLEASLAFFRLLGLEETRRNDYPQGRFTLVFLSAPGQLDTSHGRASPELELTYNWDTEDYGSARNFGHLAYEVDDIYAACRRLMDQGVTINRPPRDGRMAFVRSPDLISIELLQKGDALPPQEPWISMPNIGTW